MPTPDHHTTHYDINLTVTTDNLTNTGDDTNIGVRIGAIDLIEALDLGFNLGNALKYLVRAGRKAGETAESDLRKAAWYIDRERYNRIERNQP